MFHNHVHMTDVLKHEIIEAVELVYLAELQDKFTMFMYQSHHDLVQNLLKWYSRITDANLQDNKDHMDAPFSPDQPIDVFFKWIDDDGGTPFDA